MRWRLRPQGHLPLANSNIGKVPGKPMKNQQNGGVVAHKVMEKLKCTSCHRQEKPQE